MAIYYILDYLQNCSWFEVEEFLQQLEELANASYENSPDIVSMVEKIVPTFHPVGEKPDGKPAAK